MQIRHATYQDIAEIARIEGLSYPQAEGASRESITERVKAFPDHFWILEDQGNIVAFINGMVTDQSNLSDDMYDNAAMHNEAGSWQMIFSVVTEPDCRRKGYAGLVMKKVIEDSQAQKRKGIVLTCKEHLIHYYGKFGFVNEGISQSTHGDVVWYQMRLTL